MTEFRNSNVWMQMTISAYRLADLRGQEKMKYRFVDEIARSLLEHFPNSAHLYALEQINTVGELQTEMWRQVLTELDKLEAQNGGRVEGHISRQAGELSEDTADDRTKSD
jgi:hypothetical protein